MAARVGKSWAAKGHCVECGARCCGADYRTNQCIACQQAKARRTKAKRMTPVTATAIIDLWMR